MHRLAGVGAFGRQRQLRHAVRHPIDADQHEVGLLVDLDHFAGDAELTGTVQVVLAVGDGLLAVEHRKEDGGVLHLADDMVVGEDEPAPVIDERPAAGGEPAAAAVRVDPHGRVDDLLVHRRARVGRFGLRRLVLLLGKHGGREPAGEEQGEKCSEHTDSH